MFDLTTLDLTAAANKGTAVTIKHPITSEELPIKITVVGTDSTVFKNAIREQARKNLKNRKENVEPDYEEVNQASIELIAKCTIGWEGVSEAGKEIPFSHKACVELYTKYDWLKAQIDVAIAERSNFLLA